VNILDDIINVQFLQNYPNFTYPERPAKTRVVTLNPSDVKSGDFIGIIRMDGLDPMIAWGMGGTLGHTAMALWIDSELYVVESTVKSVYWPTNGIQKTKWATWIQQAEDADYNMVLIPLTSTLYSQFNVTSAIAWFNQVEGLPYGYHNFLFGWIDTATQNFPCLPPDYKVCLTEQLVEVAGGVVDRLDKAMADKLYNQALMHRLNLTWGSLNSTVEILEYAAKKDNINFGQLITIPEQDAWVYTDGYSMVCDVFVCSMWKHGGLFGSLTDSIQCTELTPWDVASLKFYFTGTLPSQCTKADPGLPYCQLNGRYQVPITDFNTKAPYANMAQKCPGTPPKYYRPSNC